MEGLHKSFSSFFKIIHSCSLCHPHTIHLSHLLCPWISPMCMTKTSVFTEKKFLKKLLIPRCWSWADSLADSHIKRALSLPHSSTLEHVCPIFITPFKALHLGPQVGFPLPGCHSYGSLKSSLSQQEGNWLPSDPVNVRGSLMPTLSPTPTLSALTLTQIEGTLMTVRCCFVALMSELLIKWKVRAHKGSTCSWLCCNPFL